MITRRVVLLSSMLACGCTDTDQWRFPVASTDGDRIYVSISHTMAMSIGGGHLQFGLGPSGHKWRVSFDYLGTEYKWNGERMPYLLSASPTHKPILAVFDAATSVMYQATDDGKWIEISHSVYPRDVVVPNLDHTIYSGIPPSAIRAFPKNMHYQGGTSLLLLWQTLCNIQDADLPFPERLPVECIEDLKMRAEAQYALKMKSPPP